MAITKVVLGRPGPPGAGVTAAEKASYAVKSAANTFTGTTILAPAVDSTSVFRILDAAGVVIMRASTSTRTMQFGTGASLKGYADTFSAERWVLDSATGNAQFDGYVQADGGIRGDFVTLTLPIIDGGGSVNTTGVKADFIVPYNCTVTGWTALADVSGSVSIELWTNTYANYPPTVGSLMTGTTGSNNPRISSAIKNTSTTLTGWTTALVKDRTIRMNVVSATTITRVTLALSVTRT